MHRWFVALLVAAIWAAAAVAPGAAQGCADFGSRKAAQQQLEQFGDPAGALDPDLDGFACEDELAEAAVVPAAQQVPLVGVVQINQDGTDTADDASGSSGTTVSTAPGAETTLAAEGEGNAEEAAAGDDAVASEEAAAAGDAAVADDEAGETAAADDVAATDTDAAAAVEPALAAVPAPEAVAAPAPAAAPVAPVALPNTGAGPAGRSGVGDAAVALLAVASGLALVGARRLQRG
jgi:hypothetical protein